MKKNTLDTEVLTIKKMKCEFFFTSGLGLFLVNIRECRKEQIILKLLSNPRTFYNKFHVYKRSKESFRKEIWF